VTAISWLRGVWEILKSSPPLDVSPPLDLAPDATLIAYLESHSEPIAADSPNLPLTSAPPGGASLLVPLLSQGRLVGLLTLGTPRESKAYSADELTFVATLADEAAAAARIAQLRGH
jgi:GAF domain-containing protein